MKVLDLFSGIGGFSHGLERAGMETAAFCELDPFCRAVLAKHWPNVPCYADVRTLDGTVIEVDVICGGFPCQDISFAGAGKGLAGERSGLWYEFHRLIKEIRPRYAIIENVSALRSRGLDEVLRSLAAIGYDAEWHCISASAVGAPHRRDRVWVIAYPNSEGEHDGSIHAEVEGSPKCMADSTRELFDGSEIAGQGRRDESANCGRDPILHAGCELLERRRAQSAAWWVVEPDVGRVAHGVPNRVHRLKGLGNSLVPQIAEIIGNAITDRELLS